jgi:hypothetical protein
VLFRSTTSAVLRVTPWHPFLVSDGEGRASWRRADALRPKEDLVVAVKSSPGVFTQSWATNDFLWLAGFMLGDGWVGKKHICCALSVDEELNQKVESLLAEWIPDSTFLRTPFGYLRANSSSGSNAFRVLGLTGKAKTKKVPSWVFHETPERRRAFLKGFCEADGHHMVKSTDSYAVEIANPSLLNDLRLLARTCGVRTGALRLRERSIKAPHSHGQVRSATASSCFNFATVERREAPGKWTGTRWRNNARAAVQAEFLGDSFRAERIVSVSPSGPRRVWDLTVEGTRSFVCGGLVVHNTRYHPLDLYGYLLENELKDHTQIIRALTKVGEDERGQPIYSTPWPEKFSVEYFLDKRSRKGPSVFDSQFQCDIDTARGDVFPREWFEYDGVFYDRLPEGLFKWSGVDLAIGLRERNDKFAHVTIARDVVSGVVYLIDYLVGRYSFAQQTAIIGERFLAQDPLRVGIEAVAYQAAQFQNVVKEYPEMKGRAVAVQTKIDKLSRAWRLTGLFESRMVKIRLSHADFVEHMVAFRGDNSGEDDLFDAFEIAVSMSERGARKRRSGEGTRSDGPGGRHEPGVRQEPSLRR